MRIAIASLLPAMTLGLWAAAGPWPVAAQTFTEFTLPTPASRPSAITLGPDNALWFTEFGKIGRITTQGDITEFAIKGGGIFHSITTGPDGALWFTEFTSNKIGRIPTTATPENLQLIEFTVPAPLGITTGPDGALWFTEGAGGKIGRITTAGVVAEFPIPPAKGGEITTAQDGAMWFTYPRGKIGRITTTGLVTEFAIPPENSSVGAITTGPDDALWLSGAVSGKSCGLRPMEKLPNSLFPIPMPSRGASRRGQTVPCGSQKPVAFANKVRAASLATKSAGSRPLVLSPNSRSPQTVADPTALRLDQTARCGSLSTMATGLGAWCFPDRVSGIVDLTEAILNPFKNATISVGAEV
jgi:virginiamycin B lyase